MIVVTGGLGFIGKNLYNKLKEDGYEVIIKDVKTESLDGIRDWFMKNYPYITHVFHMGAITDTTEMNTIKLDQYNYSFSIFIWNYCALRDIPLIYASSAATYGDGKNGFDDTKNIFDLKPLNPYAVSKQKFDEFAKSASHKPPLWYGLKFFNVYGFNEFEKGSMASMILHGYTQAKYKGSIKLFKSYEDNYGDGEQARDFIYVDDVVDACMFFMKETPKSGIYNIGTGKARTFNDLAKSIFKSLDLSENIVYIDMPESLKDKYQYFTEANINKITAAGYNKKFTELEDGISKYIQKLK